MNPSTQEEKIAALEEENKALRERIAELERRLKIDSNNSSKPPSLDGLKKKNTHRTRTLRNKGQGKTGGQKGHRGQTLEQVSEPDLLVNICYCVYLITHQMFYAFSLNPMSLLPIIKPSAIYG
jgi:transposase